MVIPPLTIHLPFEVGAVRVHRRLAEHVILRKNIHLLNGKFYLCYQQGFIKWLEESNPSALIVEANPRYLSTPSAVKWMHKRGRKVIGWGLGFPSPVLGEGIIFNV